MSTTRPRHVRDTSTGAARLARPPHGGRAARGDLRQPLQDGRSSYFCFHARTVSFQATLADRFKTEEHVFLYARTCLFQAILADLFSLATASLVPGGRLVFLLPCTLPLAESLALLPPHPTLEVPPRGRGGRRGRQRPHALPSRPCRCLRWSARASSAWRRAGRAGASP